MELIVNNSGKKIKLNVKRTGIFSRGLGLMFRSRNTDNLLFEFNSDTKMSITSFFVFFSFLIVWLDKNNKVLEIRIVSPFNLALNPKRKFRRFVEVPINRKNQEIIDFFVGKKRKV